jgi:L-ribulose-5-phosphate 3-epimerase UlaE
MSRYELGIMQGRLLPKLNNRYQAHPLGYWQDEFLLAKELNLDLIEFIFDYDDYKLNPLMSLSGIENIKKYINETGVNVKTICADYFMEAPIHSKDEFISKKSIRVLKKLIKNSLLLGVTDIILPCVDHSRLLDSSDRNRLITCLKSLNDFLEEYRINISLETDLNPSDFLDIIKAVDSPFVKINYDTGNSASLGYDLSEEFSTYGEYISDIHVKDRILNGSSVFFGEGNVDFDLFFKELKELKYDGPIIFQLFRDEEGVEVFKKQFELFNK